MKNSSFEMLIFEIDRLSKMYNQTHCSESLIIGSDHTNQ